MISKLGFKRLYRLCDFAESLPKEANKHFDMGDYLRHSGDHDHDTPVKPKLADLMTCGTTACMLGWACAVPAFQRAGLSGANLGHTSSSFFGLSTDDEWHRLFGPENNDRTPKAWAKRARRLLKKWEAAARTPVATA